MVLWRRMMWCGCEDKDGVVVCRIMGTDSDDTSAHGEWFEGGGRIVNQEKSFGIGRFLFVLSLLVLLYG